MALKNHILYRRLSFLIIIILISSTLKAQDLKAYQIYNQKGKAISFGEMIQQIDKKYDVVLFGEFHNNALIHWLELRTTKALYQKKETKLILGAEMFERDNQKQLQDYLSGNINNEELEEQARLWPNFETDYKPLVDFAKDKGLQFIATNIPRHYAQLVAQNGLDTLSNLTKKDKQYIADLPIKFNMKTPGYQEMEEMMKSHAGDNAKNYVKAQATKDATMAESIYKNWKKGDIFIHFNGNFHSKEHGGIYWYLRKEKKFLQRLKVAVINVIDSDDAQLSLPKDAKTTEYNIVIPADMTKTY